MESLSPKISPRQNGKLSRFLSFFRLQNEKNIMYGREKFLPRRLRRQRLPFSLKAFFHSIEIAVLCFESVGKHDFRISYAYL